MTHWPFAVPFDILHISVMRDPPQIFDVDSRERIILHENPMVRLGKCLHLEAAIRYANGLYIRDREIRRSDMEEITSILIWKDRLGHLCGDQEPKVKEYCDISPLNGLRKLSYICMDFPARELSTLVTLPNLTMLSVSCTRTRDMALLGKLESLSLESKQVSDLNPLAKLNNLGNLCVSHNRIEDLQPLVGLRSLKYLFIENNPICEPQKKRLVKAFLKYDIHFVPKSFLARLV